MTEDKSFNSDYELIQFNDEIKNENNTQDIFKSCEEVMKEYKRYGEIIKSEKNLNVQELKQNYQKMIGEIKSENDKQISSLKEIIEQKDEKINSFENKIKEMKKSTDKKISELTLELEKNNLYYKNLCFVHVANKWKEFDFKYNFYKCCEKECINTKNPIGKCIKGNGFANIINDENIEYIEWFKVRGHFGGHDNPSHILAENPFNKPKEDYNNYSLFYFEIKCKFEEENDSKKWIQIGLINNKNNNIYLTLSENSGSLYHYKGDGIDIENIVWTNNDIFGCGLVYPPTNKISKEFPYIFFTQNGEQIGKAILLKDNFGDCKPYVGVVCCSLEANFGNDLKAKPFVYDFSKHTQYSDFEKDLNELVEIFPLIGKEAIKQILLSHGGIKENVLEKLNEIFPKDD